MIYIQKENEPQEVIRWKRKFKNVYKRKPFYQDICKEKEKQILKEALIKEQKKICCYCCGRIQPENSHIEHFRPKGEEKYKHLSLEYENLHACCCTEQKKEKHCGATKGKQFDSELMISPLDKNCEKRFRFSSKGKIFPTDEKDMGARYTIDLLNLNEDSLCIARKTAMETAEKLMVDELEEYEEELNLIAFMQGDNSSISEWKEKKLEEKKKECIERYTLEKNTEYAPYCDAIVYWLTNEI